MAIPMQGSQEALFNRLGAMGSAVKQRRTNQTAMLARLTGTGLNSRFPGEPDIQARIGAAYIGLLNQGGEGSLMAALTSDTFNRMVFRDNPRFAQTLSQVAITDSIAEVIRQMKAQGESVLAQTISTSFTPFTRKGVALDGLGVIVASTRRPSDGLILQNALAETIEFTVAGDQYTGGANAGNESLSFEGTGEQSDPWAFNWPLGSGCAGSVQAIDGSADNADGNLGTNTGYESWSGNTPLNFTINGGAAIIGRETTETYDPSPSSALRITGNGSTLVDKLQLFNNAAGSIDQLEPLTQYSYVLFHKRGAAAVTNGSLRVDLVDGNQAVVNDEDGTANRLTIDLTALTTGWTYSTFSIRTPRIMPSTYGLRWYNPAGGAVSSGHLVYLDRGGIGLMTQTTRSGIYVSAHSGKTPFADGDLGKLAVTNSRGAAGTLDTFQTLLYRLLHPLVRDEEVIFPYSSTPTLSDAGLITP